MALWQLSNRCYESFTPIGFCLSLGTESKEWHGESMKLHIRKIPGLLDEDLSREPCISAAERITKAIEAMLKNDFRRIAVTNTVGRIHDVGDKGFCQMGHRQLKQNTLRPQATNCIRVIDHSHYNRRHCFC